MAYTTQRDSFARDRLPPPEERPTLLFERDELHFPERLNAAWNLLDRHVEQGNGGRISIRAPGMTWTFAELQAAANRIANVLVEDYGIEPGNRVLLRAPNTPMLAACWFAVLKVGGIAVTTMPLYRAAELRAMIQKAQVSLALCDARLCEELNQARAEGALPILLFQSDAANGLEARMQRASARFTTVKTAAEDIALIAFTSGTTGAPKAAMHPHRALLATCETYGKYVLQPRADDIFCGSPPLAFTFGLGGMLLFPLHVGASTVLLEKAGPEELLRAVAEFRITTLFTAPIAYRAMTPLLDRYDTSTLRTCVSAGEPLAKPIWDAWHERTGIAIMDGIGSTEMLHIFIGSPASEVRPGATGRPVPGYIAEVHDDAGARLLPGEIGRLAVRGPTGCVYLDDPRQKRYVSSGWNYPGDAYRVDEDGYFWYVARADDMIISAGFNISGPEVEEALLAHSDVKECAVVAKPDPTHMTNIVKAFIVLADDKLATDAKVDELIAFCKQQIAPFKAPREVEFVTQLPRTETGKVQRYKLRERS